MLEFVNGNHFVVVPKFRRTPVVDGQILMPLSEEPVFEAIEFTQGKLKYLPQHRLDALHLDPLLISETPRRSSRSQPKTKEALLAEYRSAAEPKAKAKALVVDKQLKAREKAHREQSDPWKDDLMPITTRCHTSNAHKGESCASNKVHHDVPYYDSGPFDQRHSCGALFLKSEMAEIKKSGTKCPACMGGQLDLKVQFDRLQKPMGVIMVSTGEVRYYKYST